MGKAKRGASPPEPEQPAPPIETHYDAPESSPPGLVYADADAVRSPDPQVGLCKTVVVIDRVQFEKLIVNLIHGYTTHY